ncbi:chemotaxis protein [Allochromatium humboldtianum]|uniref:Chemotaxis protein n=1 Tax=Allochromatium humboldtianum TaxID=504901 RepID=A0A850REK7_9GAMM|nr:chemotaxis protein [Allochromatium humboldtianum]NVZ11415.1 chemotaxis protein [Allochromatium humboldtianum]
MPLPIIIGAAALATAAYGAKKGYDGYQKHSEADEIVKSAKSRYERKKSAFDEKEAETTLVLEMLGKKELEIGQSFGEFKTLADKLLQQLQADRQNKLEIRIPKHELQKIESYSYTAAGVLGTVVGAGAAGAAAGFAVYGGVMALGAASTGTAISSLAGVAATNATLAAIGGGSLATGGLGMAGGTAILGAAVAAPILAIAGWAYNSHGEEALKNAHKADNEVSEAVGKLGRAIEQLILTEEYARKIKGVLSSIYGQFNQYFDSLKEIDSFLQDLKGRNIDEEAELAKLNDEIIRIIENGYALAAILVDVITTPIFKVKKVNGEVLKDENDVPVMERDEDDFMIVNETNLDKALIKARSDAGGIATI